MRTAELLRPAPALAFSRSRSERDELSQFRTPQCRGAGVPGARLWRQADVSVSVDRAQAPAGRSREGATALGPATTAAVARGANVWRLNATDFSWSAVYRLAEPEREGMPGPPPRRRRPADGTRRRGQLRRSVTRRPRLLLHAEAEHRPRLVGLARAEDRSTGSPAGSASRGSAASRGRTRRAAVRRGRSCRVRAVEEVARVELHARLGRLDLQRAAARRLGRRAPGASLRRPSPAAVQHPVVVVAAAGSICAWSRRCARRSPSACGSRTACRRPAPARRSGSGSRRPACSGRRGSASRGRGSCRRLRRPG